MRPLLIVKTGQALPRTRERCGDFEHWIASAMGWALDRFLVAPVHEGARLPDPASVSGVIVTGSPAMVSDREAWSVEAGGWLASAVSLGSPVFGICYGHQLLAEALGGSVGKSPVGREIGTVEVERLDDAGADPLFGAVPERFEVHVTHVESVLSLPPGARRLAGNAADPHHAVAFASRAWGVQFHPEFDGEVMRGYLDERGEVLASEGLDPDGLRRNVRECPDSRALLQRFGTLVESWEE
ncbi:MAG: glutamine amidotransferase [Myxococcota bacterium]